MALSKIKRNDTVVLIAGKDKGTTGRVLKVIPAKDNRKANRILVEGANLVKKHVKPNPNKGDQGGIISREASLDISNVALFNPKTKCADKVGIKILEDGRKVRFFKSDGELVDVE